MNSAATTTNGKVLQGVVVKAAMKDTCTVAIQRYVKHPKYEKYLKSTKKFLVHDAGNTAKVGDHVEIREVKPISKRKFFTLASVVRAAVSEE
jgi:small subunit ribosomal protein S17